jgi:hypothetical protein
LCRVDWWCPMSASLVFIWRLLIRDLTVKYTKGCFTLKGLFTLCG